MYIPDVCDNDHRSCNLEEIFFIASIASALQSTRFQRVPDYDPLTMENSTDHLTHTHCPFWTQKFPCFRPHSVEKSA